MRKCSLRAEGNQRLQELSAARISWEDKRHWRRHRKMSTTTKNIEAELATESNSAYESTLRIDSRIDRYILLDPAWLLYAETTRAWYIKIL